MPLQNGSQLLVGAENLKVEEAKTRGKLELDDIARVERFKTVITTLIEKDHLGDWSPEKDCCYY